MLQHERIHFNKTCLKMKIVPKYAHTKILAHNTEAKKTQSRILQIKSEINFCTKRKTAKQRTIPCTHITRKHMATHLDQHLTINKPKTTT
jgi:hypothetical protein